MALELFKIFYILESEKDNPGRAFPVEIAKTETVYDLKEAIKAKVSSLAKYDAYSIVLNRVDILADGDYEENIKNATQIRLNPMQKLEAIFPTGPQMNTVHIIVHTPVEPPAAGKASTGFPGKHPHHSGPESLVANAEWCPRQDTVTGVLELLHKHHLVQVHGTPASGKTTLMYLLHARILEKHPEAEVFIHKYWPGTEWKETSVEQRLMRYLPGYPSFDEKERYFLFDEGHGTYSDTTLWAAFKDFIHSSRNPVYTILFCPYRQEAATDPGLPLSVDLSAARVTLVRADLGGSKPCGLLLDEEEFRDFIHRQMGTLLLAEDLCDFVYRFTRGYVGGVIAVTSFLSEKQDSSMLTGIPYCLEDFHKDTLSYDKFCRHIYTDPGVGRGLSRYPHKFAPALRALLLHGSISVDNTSISADIASCLREAYTWGQIYIDGADQYIFSSPLHQQVWSWRLKPTDYQIPHQDLISFVKDSIPRFRPERLDKLDRQVGSASHRSPEAQYQEEYYRCVHNLMDGNVRITPEYAAATGSRPGRIDFFIPSKNWGIELTRDGNQLSEHETRFVDDNAYGQWLQSSDMADYVLLDFCSTMPVRTHPGIRKLYHLVFSNDNTQVEIYDNQLNLQARNTLMQ